MNNLTYKIEVPFNIKMHLIIFIAQFKPAPFGVNPYKQTQAPLLLVKYKNIEAPAYKI